MKSAKEIRCYDMGDPSIDEWKYNRDSYFHEVKIIRRAVSFGEHEF